MTRSTLAARHGPTSTTAEIVMLQGLLVEQRSFRVEQLRQLSSPGSAAPLSSTDPEIMRELRTGARAALHDVQAALWPARLRGMSR